jgi:SNF2 family DNA or RNA helicase
MISSSAPVSSPSPGARVVIRDEEWLVLRTDPTSDGGFLLTCDGVSDLVRGRSALFLSELEEDIEVLDPANTVLVPDTSRTYNDAVLYLESHRRRSIPNDELIHLGHRGVMNLVPYQLDPALQALTQPRSRILMADATGLGKTLEAGILATELIQRGRGKRILVVALKSMLTQFQKEWWSRFSIPLVRLDSVGLARVRNRIPANHNPFNHFDRSIISIDTLKSNLEYRNYLENAWWDIIVIDECQNVAARAGEEGVSRRARLARMLASRSDTLILLSATPHDGSARSFASLMSLLDPTAISDPDNYTPEDFRHKGLVIRRFKKDIRDQVENDFQERVTTRLRQASKSGDLDQLRGWISEVRVLAKEADREVITDQQIGQILAYAPTDSDDGAWPSRKIRDLIEELGADEVETGIAISRFNQRGAFSKELYDGGGQESGIAKQYRDWAATARHWPRTKALLERIAEDWDRQARRADTETKLDQIRYS